MRWVYGMVLAGGLACVAAPAASAQDLGAFGGYPAGITSDSAYGFYPGGYRQNYTTYRTPTGYVASPRVTYYSSGFYGGTPGTTAYSPGVNFSSPNAAAYGYSAPLYGTTGYVPSTGTYYATPARRGLFGRRTYYYAR